MTSPSQDTTPEENELAKETIKNFRPALQALKDHDMSQSKQLTEEELKRKIGHGIAHGTYMDDEAREAYFNEVMSMIEAHSQLAVEGVLGKVKEIIGEDIDLKAKYETMGIDGGISVTIDDNEVITGENLVHLAQFTSDKAENDLRTEQRKRVEELFK